MNFDVVKTQLADIESLRQLFLADTKFQFVYNKCHGAGWADVYRFANLEVPIGYGSVWGKDKREDRDTIFEFYLKAPFIKYAHKIFSAFIKQSGARYIECQTNDRLLSHMLFEIAENIRAEAILFEDDHQTAFQIPGARFVKTETPEEGTQYVVQREAQIVATGGYVWNYNFPYIDMYYEVKDGFRQKGYGSLMVQALKEEAYRSGRVPVARCHIQNQASKATLLKGGMRICGYIVTGDIK